jgi:hypothetical protein
MGGSLDWESDSREIRYKIGPLGRKTKVGFKICVAPRCDPATPLIAGNHQRKRLLQRFRATVKCYFLKRELIQVDFGLPDSGATVNLTSPPAA